MKILYVTVGTSAIKNPGIGRPPDGRDNATLQGDMRLYREDKGKDFGRWGKLFDDLVKAHVRYWEMPEDYTTDPRNFEQSSAELTSTYFLFREMSFDKLVLLPTDTPDGKMASQVVLAVMKSTPYGVRVAKDRIIEEPILGLERDMDKLDAGLRAAILKHDSLSRHDERYVNVTGGFKGTSLMLGRLSTELDYEVYYQHETSHAPIHMRDVWKS
jgi:putative CRISPR-associated protein (TIGR02619 family)